MIRGLGCDWAASVPILAVTASATLEDRKKAAAAGMNGFVPKPIDFPSLIELLLSSESAARSLPARESAKPELPDFDPAPLSRLEELQQGGERSLVQELIAIFLRQTPERLRVLRAAIENGDFIKASEEAHSLKSSCGYLGALKMEELCREVEETAAEAGRDRLAQLAARLGDAFEVVRLKLSA